MMKTLLTTVCLLVTVAIAQAGSFSDKQVAHDAMWTAHVNFDHLRTNPAVRWLLDQVLMQQMVQDKVQRIRTDIGLDPADRCTRHYALRHELPERAWCGHHSCHTGPGKDRAGSKVQV